MINHSAVSDRFLKILDRLACPQCLNGLNSQKRVLECSSCGVAYPIVDGIVDLRLPTKRDKDEMMWSEHWSDEQQQRISQQLFSFSRKALFSRTVRFFFNRYFPSNGVFVEAGSGTSETSILIEKHDGARTLVATDIVLPVLKRGHAIMDVRVCGDIFRLPFRESSIDGIWNVGVMEHFTYEQIDQVMREFHRVLRHGSRIILLWPGADSVPQRLLRIMERVINSTRKATKEHDVFRFHHIPDEISQLRSIQEGREVLVRNGFDPLHIDSGLRSLMTFKILVGVKNSVQ